MKMTELLKPSIALGDLFELQPAIGEDYESSPQGTIQGRFISPGLHFLCASSQLQNLKQDVFP